MDGLLWVLRHLPEFIILISIVITVHELGHYWVGRAFGAAVESFSVGFGRPIFQVKDKRGTRWRVNWLPLGGFVKFVGEIQAPQDTLQSVSGPVGKSFLELGPWRRIAVALGGPVANFIFAILVFAAIGLAFGVPQAKEVLVTQVAAGTPAEAAGFKPGDVLVEAGGKTVVTSDDVTRPTQLSAGEAVTYRVKRGTEFLTLTATPVEQDYVDDALRIKQRIGRIGLGLAQRDVMMRTLNPIEALSHGVKSTADALGDTLNVLRRLVTGKEGLDKLSGPLGILSLTGSVSDLHMNQEGVGFGEKLGQLAITLLRLAALLSIGVGFFNLLPIPVLDGGAVVMSLAEGLTGRPIPEKVQQVGLTIGLVCLVAFALVITFQDVQRFPGAP
jgi:regulator of sigma E protease